MYRLTGVTKLYRSGRRTIRAVAGLDLVIGDGEWLAVQGRTGHGKSTLLSLLGGLDRPTRGTIEFDQVDLGALRKACLIRLRAQATFFESVMDPYDAPAPGHPQQQHRGLARLRSSGVAASR
jgi:putative ABC transport system ATP-binding protein